MTGVARAALIGAGAGARRVLLPGLTALDSVELVAVCDIDQGTARAVAEPLRIPAYCDAAAMLDQEQPDLVVIATPPMTHYQLCQLGLAHGCHVFCEKPFVSSVAEADAVIRTAKDLGLHVGVNNQYYQMPIFQALAQELRRERAGRLFHVAAWQHMLLLPEAEMGWKAALSPRRVLYEFGTHVVDLMCRFFGDYPQGVTAQIAEVRPDLDADVCVVVRLDFPGRRVASMAFNRMSHAPNRYLEMRLDCERESLRASLGGIGRIGLEWNAERRRPRFRFSLTRGGEARREHAGRSSRLCRQGPDCYGVAGMAHLSEFIDRVQSGVDPSPAMAHAREVLRVVLTAYEAATEGGTMVRL